MLNVLLAENDINFATSLMNEVNKRSEKIKISRISRTEEETIKILNSKQSIDIIIVGLKKTIKSKEKMLERIEDKEKYKSNCILLGEEPKETKTYNPLINSIICKYKDIENLANEIVGQLEKREKEKDEKEFKDKIIKEVLYLGYNLSYKGTAYLIESIKYVAANPDKDSLEGDVYPEISKKLNNTVHNIKSNINRANNAMYYDCEMQKLADYFAFSGDTKPRIKTVIHTIINKIS